MGEQVAPLEASLLERHLLESLVQLRYYESRRAQVEEILDPARAKRTRLRPMFDAVAPGYYVNPYGLLSNAAHGRLAASLFRLDEQNRILLGCHYNEFWATSVLNVLHPLLLGFLHLFPRHFPEFELRAEVRLQTDRREVMDWLKRAFEAHLTAQPQSATWHGQMRRIIDFEVPTP